MITIEELEKQREKLKGIREENTVLYHELSDLLLSLMVKYKQVAEWYVDNNLSRYTFLGSVILLSEDENYCYYWDPKDEEPNIRRYNKIENKKGVYSPYHFIVNGHFETARDNILALNTVIQNLIEELRRERAELEKMREKSR